MNKLEKFFGRSVFGRYDDKEEQLIMNSTTNLNYSSTYDISSNTNENNNTSNKSRQIDCIERDVTENDLFYLDEKSKAHKIDEWQAGWNVTNAIQVAFFFSK